MQPSKAVANVSRVAGREVEITVRGARSFTFYYPEVDQTATKRLVHFFKAHARMEVSEDAECGTFVYCDFDAGIHLPA